MNIEERPISKVLQSELDAFLRDGLRTIGFAGSPENSEEITKKLTDFLIEFSNQRQLFSENQVELLLVQLGAVVAHLFIERYGFHWACADDPSGSDFYFIASRDKKFMLQPWTFLQDIAQRPEPQEAVLRALEVPQIAELNPKEMEKIGMQYHDIGMAIVALNMIAELSQNMGDKSEEEMEAEVQKHLRFLYQPDAE